MKSWRRSSSYSLLMLVDYIFVQFYLPRFAAYSYVQNMSDEYFGLTAIYFRVVSALTRLSEFTLWIFHRISVDFIS